MIATTSHTAGLQAALDEAPTGSVLTRSQAHLLAGAGADALPDLMAAARCVRSRRQRAAVTFSRSVFVPLTNICRDRCGYCVFRRKPGEPGAFLLTPDDVRKSVASAAAMGCQEVLFTLGDKPDVFRAVRAQLAGLGYPSMAEYLTAMCRLVVEEFGLFPHTNAGVMPPWQMADLRPWNLSMGLMLESVSERLLAPGGPHADSPDKRPADRLRTIEAAGKLSVPFTTGLLIGIGETVAERVDTLLAIRDVQARTGHIQEVIVQNFRRKPGTPMAGYPEPTHLDLLEGVALARLILGADMNIQAPPNLNPESLHLLLEAGINDWGGVSPLTEDFINPEMPWPQLSTLQQVTAAAGLTLRERLPVYPEFLLPDNFVDPHLRARALAAVDSQGYVIGKEPA